jgi:hypothetical protein
MDRDAPLLKLTLLFNGFLIVGEMLTVCFGRLYLVIVFVSKQFGFHPRAPPHQFCPHLVTRKISEDACLSV